MKGGMKMYKTFSQMNELLRCAANISAKTYNGWKNIEGIAEVTGISASMLYKWRAGNSNLSGDKFDSLLIFFQEKEPQRLKMAEKMMGW